MIRVCTTTLPESNEGHALAATLASEVVARRLAACVQIDASIRSFYRWKGKVGDDREFRLTFKTTASAVDALFAYVRSVHLHDVPQWVVVEAETSEAYGRWVAESCLP